MDKAGTLFLRPHPNLQYANRKHSTCYSTSTRPIREPTVASRLSEYAVGLHPSPAATPTPHDDGTHSISAVQTTVLGVVHDRIDVAFVHNLRRVVANFDVQVIGPLGSGPRLASASSGADVKIELAKPHL